MLKRSTGTRLAATLLQRDTPGFGQTAPIEREEAFLFALQVRPVTDHDLFIRGRSVRPGKWPAGVTTIYDLTRDPVAVVLCPFKSIHFYVPRTAIDEFAREIGAQPMHRLDYVDGTALNDPILRHLALASIQALEHPTEVTPLLLDSVAAALHAHVASTYCGVRPPAAPARGGLAPWQERRAKEKLAARLHGTVALDELARECGLSRSHFVRAFRATVGATPHRWLTERRIEVAKGRLLEGRSSLSAIALECGFCDQSHFTRVFSRLVGEPPGAWRRRHRR